MYEQYWLHGRHLHHERWLFTSVFGVLTAAILAGSAATNDSTIQLALVGFGALIALLGFSLEYALYRPFMKFVLRAELIAINDLGLPYHYRRFFTGFPRDQILYANDIIQMFYAAVAGLMLTLVTLQVSRPAALLLGLATSAGLVLLHFMHLRPLHYRSKVELEAFIRTPAETAGRSPP